MHFSSVYFLLPSGIPGNVKISFLTSLKLTVMWYMYVWTWTWMFNSNPPGEGGGGTLGIFGWGCAAGTLEPLTYTRASSAEFCYPILE